jgi:predicted ester cyclase
MKRSNHVIQNAIQISGLILLGLTISFQPQAANAQSEKAMKAIVDQWLEVWNTNNLALVDKIFASTAVRHEVGVAEHEGADALKQHAGGLRTAYPDFKATSEAPIIKGDRIVVLGEYSGTNTGASDIPPTGKKVKGLYCAIFRMVDGKIAEEWLFYNQASVLTQLGYTITPPATPSVK